MSGRAPSLMFQTQTSVLPPRVLQRLKADLKAEQARRRELKPLLADLLRVHAANRAEIARKILTFVGFDSWECDRAQRARASRHRGNR
jgi:hypothetical protein